MVVTTQVNCKATSKNIEKSQQVFQDQPIKIETVQRIYLSCQILYVINLLKGTLSILNCDSPFGLQLDQAENKQFLFKTFLVMYICTLWWYALSSMLKFFAKDTRDCLPYPYYL